MGRRRVASGHPPDAAPRTLDGRDRGRRRRHGVDLDRLEVLAEKLELFLEHNDLHEPGMHMHITARTASGEATELLLAGPVQEPP